MRRSCFQRFGQYSEQHSVLGDYLYAFGLHRGGAVGVSIDRVTTHFRHYGGESSTRPEMFQEFNEHYRELAAQLNLTHEQFLFFLYYANRFLGNGILRRPPDRGHLGPALSRLEACGDRRLALDFQKSLLFCLFSCNTFPADPTADPQRRQAAALIAEVRDALPVSDEEAELLCQFPFLEQTEPCLFRLDRLLDQMNRLPHSEPTFRLQQLWLNQMYRMIVA